MANRCKVNKPVIRATRHCVTVLLIHTSSLVNSWCNYYYVLYYNSTRTNGEFNIYEFT